jgi:hypothetical protein
MYTKKIAKKDIAKGPNPLLDVSISILVELENVNLRIEPETSYK